MRRGFRRVGNRAANVRVGKIASHAVAHADRPRNAILPTLLFLAIATAIPSHAIGLQKQ